MANAMVMILLLVVSLSAAAYAHYRLPYQTPTRTQLWITRVLLLGVGLGFGWAMSGVYLEVEGAEATVVFLSAFGVAHVPAAIILFLKKIRSRQLGEGNSHKSGRS